MSENIAGEVPYLESLLDLMQTKKEAAMACLDNILSGLGEILPLSQIFSFELYEVLAYLIKFNESNKNSQAAVVLLKSLSKFDTLANNEEYTFDEDKNTKEEINEIYNLLKRQKEYFWNAQKNFVKNELDEEKAGFPRVMSALRMIAEYGLVNAKDEVKALLDSKNEIIICEALNTLRQIGGLDGINKQDILNKVTDENKKALIESLF